MPNQTSIRTASEILFGGWSSYGPIDLAEMKIFNEAVGPSHTIGHAVYIPETVATQMVAGLNYKFKCKVVPVQKDLPLQWKAIVEVYSPLQGKSRVVHVTTY